MAFHRIFKTNQILIFKKKNDFVWNFCAIFNFWTQSLFFDRSLYFCRYVMFKETLINWSNQRCIQKMYQKCRVQILILMLVCILMPVCKFSVSVRVCVFYINFSFMFYSDLELTHTFWSNALINVWVIFHFIVIISFCNHWFVYLFSVISLVLVFARYRVARGRRRRRCRTAFFSSGKTKISQCQGWLR